MCTQLRNPEPRTCHMFDVGIRENRRLFTPVRDIFTPAPTPNRPSGNTVRFQISQAQGGSAKAVETLAKMSAKNAALFQRIAPMLFRHLRQIPPSLEENVVIGGSARSLTSVELVIHCVDALFQGFGYFVMKVLNGQSTHPTLIVEANHASDLLANEWVAIHRWITFFVGCLDFHRLATLVILEY
ncbi:hypothetical protein C8J56DRAFT_886803 [Mycena floridula]|nr:hypothetical protein C8J56DRAFT_886803 [Mycena floridula]